MSNANTIPISLQRYTVHHILFAIFTGIIMAISLFYLKLGADASLFARDGRIAPAFFFFGDTHTLSKYVQKVIMHPKEGFENESIKEIPSLSTYYTHIENLYNVFVDFIINKIGVILNYIIIPTVSKYTYI